MKKSTKVRKSAFLATTGVVSVLFATPAFADCAPDPANNIDPITCTGTDSDGLINTSTQYIDVKAGADVSKIISTAVSPPGTFYPLDNYSNLNVSGAVHGVVVESGQPTLYYPFGSRSNLEITVQNGGVIDGLGVQLRSNSVNPGFPQPYSATASVTNSGTISATSGAGLVAIETQVAAFSNINNLASGTIRGIYAPFNSLNNQGAITANGGEAIVYLSPYFGNFGIIENSGTISSPGGGFATIDLRLGSFANQFVIRNSGSIMNSGAGVAIAAGQGTPGYNSFVISIENSGTISSGGYGISVSGDVDLLNTGTINAGSVAVYASGGLKLRNYGTINGTVRAEGLGLYPWQNPPMSTILLGAGSHINGDLILGAGDDVVQIQYGGGSLSDLVSGTIDAGSGNNSVRYLFGAGVTEVSSALTAPSGFQSFSAELIGGADVRLVSGFALNGPLSVTAGGDFSTYGVPMLTNATDVVSSDTAFIVLPKSTYYASSLNFINAGTITANLAQADKFAVVIHDGQFENNSSIVVNGGNGVYSDAYSFVINRGAINATGTGVDGINVYNSGTINSLLGTGVSSRGNVENYSAGIISGQTIGLSLNNGTLANTGTISSPGVGLLLSGYTMIIDNRVGGVISGGSSAISIDPSTDYHSGYQVKNAGTINGDVNLAVGFASQNSSYEVFGTGTLNGNLYLGQGKLIVEYGGSGPLGGITGTIVTDPGATLQYRVIQDTTIAFPSAPAGGLFTNVVWSLQNAKLTLTGPAPTNPYILVEGFGSVDLNATINSDALRPIIEGYVAVNNLGTVAVSHNSAGQDPTVFGAFATSTVINTGTIIVKDTAPASSGLLARGINAYYASVNNGQIQVSGAIGVVNRGQYGYAQFENNGTITQLKGGAAGIGLINVGYAVNAGSITTAKVGVINLGSFSNSGTVRSEGPAVQMGSLDSDLIYYGGGSVQNNGLLESTKGPAIRGISPAGSYAFIMNGASGIIRGKPGGPAIVFDQTVSILNFGLIDGDVQIGQSNVTYPYWTNSFFQTYSGSTLKGNLIFGSGSDAFFYRGGTITGIVDGGSGAGNDTLYLDFSQSTATGFDLRKYRNFEDLQLFGGSEFSFNNAPVFENISLFMKAIVPANQSLVARQNTLLSSGWLQVDGAFTTGHLELGYNSIISGSGLFNASSVTINGGFVVPGSDGVIGRLTVVGSVNFQYGGALMIDVGTGDNDRLIIKKDAAGYNGSLQLDPLATYFVTGLNLRSVGTGPRFGKVYTIITADNGVNGQFGSVQGSFGVLTPQVTYGANAVTLTFNASSLAAQLPQGATPLEMSFAKSLDGLRASNYGSLSSLYGTVDLLDPRSLGLALDGLNPHVAVEASGFYQQQNAQMFDLVTDRMALLGSGQVAEGRIEAVGLSGGVAGLVNAPAASQYAASQASLTRSFSGLQLPGVVLGNGMSGFISGGVETRRSQLSQGGQQGTDRRNWHMAMGLEMPLGDQSRLGVAVLHAEGISGRSGMQTDVVSSQAAAYATWQLSPRAYLGGAASMGVNHVGVQRQSWVDSSALNLTGRGTSFSYAVQAEAGYRQPLGSWGAITPRIALRQSSFSIDRLSESGGQAALRLTNIGQNQLDMRIGLRFDAKADLGSGWQISPRAEVEYVRTLAGGHGEMTVQFAAVDMAGFILPFGDQGGSALRAKGGLTVSRQQTSFTLAGSSEQDWAGRRDSRVAAELRFGF